MKNLIIPYKEIRPQLDTFTIVNCVHRAIPWKWIGHTAILWKCDKTGQLMIFESTTLNKFTGISGVQMIPFGQWLKLYPGHVFVRIPGFYSHLDGVDHRYKERRLAEKFIEKHIGTSYPDLKTRSGRFKLYMAALDFKLFGVDWFSYKGNEHGIFCTELVVLMLQYCGLLDKTYYACEYIPDDLREYNLKFIDNLSLFLEYSDEIQLK